MKMDVRATRGRAAPMASRISGPDCFPKSKVFPFIEKDPGRAPRLISTERGPSPTRIVVLSTHSKVLNLNFLKLALLLARSQTSLVNPPVFGVQ
ncbi:hypothetical protein D3C87_1171860 [compost metagenome]